MYELQWLAFQADLTRVVTFMLGRELNFRTYPEIGLTQGHHTMSHHQEKPENIERYAKLNTYQTDLFAWFLNKLAVDAGGRRHVARPLAVLVRRPFEQSELARALRSADRARRRTARPARAAGSTVVEPSNTPMSNLLLTHARRASACRSRRSATARGALSLEASANV